MGFFVPDKTNPKRKRGYMVCRHTLALQVHNSKSKRFSFCCGKCHRPVVILSEAKNLAFFEILRFAQDDKNDFPQQKRFMPDID
jgi:hypothetical protein